MFEDDKLQSSDILQYPPEIQFEIDPPFNVSNTKEQFIYYDTIKEMIFSKIEILNKAW